MRLLLSALSLILLPLSVLAAAPPHDHAHEHAHAHSEHSAAAAPAASLGSHQHGVAQLDVVLEAGELQIDWHTPAANLLGFEHAPRTAAERQAVQQLQAALQEGAALFALPAAAGCTAATPSLNSPLFETHAPADATHAHEHEHEHKPAAAAEHSDIQARYRFTCQQPAALESLNLEGLFVRFAGLERLQVQLIGPAGQQGLSLDARHSQLRF